MHLAIFYSDLVSTAFSSTFEEFARKWNKPVYNFLFRHVYKEFILTLKMTKDHALTLTFLLSSLLHEFVFAVVARRIIFVFFFFQMSQILWTWLCQRSFIKSRWWLGNAIFWLGMYLGPPSIVILYSRDYPISDLF